MCAIKTFAYVAILFPVIIGSNGQRLQRIRFFQGNSCTQAQYQEFTESRNVSGTTQLTAYCVISGVWRVEYAYVMNENDYTISVGDACTTCIRSTNNRAYGYIRHISGQDLTKPSISFYPERGFAGKEVPIIGNEYSFESTQSFLSFGFTSFNNWTWQTYQLPQYRGESRCYMANPTVAAEVTYFDSTAVSVGSVRLGCRNSASPRYKDVGFLLIIIFAFAVPSLAVIL